MNSFGYTALAAIAVLVIALGAWFFFLRSSAPAPETNSGEPFTSSENVSTVGTTGSGATNNAQQIPTTQQTARKVFQIAAGPIAGATFMQTLRPTTTVARYVQASNGHVFDLVLDSPGAVPRSASNTTIPGVVRTVWTEGGRGVVVQYVDDTVLKSAHLALPAPATSTSSIPPATRIQFLPDNATSLVASPGGEQVAYLLQTSTGVAGYTADTDGSGSERLFTLPLSEVLLSWPAPNTLLVQTKAAAGAPGMVFSVSVANGAVVPLLYAPGLTATANSTFSHLVYNTVPSISGTHPTYVRNMQSGSDSTLLLDPFLEKCAWSNTHTHVLYCASPLGYPEGSYLDFWHMGVTDFTDSIFGFNVVTGVSDLVTTPGLRDGGVTSAAEALTISPEDRYLLFVARGSQSLWGVRLLP